MKNINLIKDRETFKRMLNELIEIKKELKNINKNLIMVNNELMRLR